MPPAAYEVLEGYVQQLSQYGFMIQDQWANWGNRYDGRRVRAGEQVKVRLQGKYVVHLVDIAEQLPPEPAPRRAGGAFRSPEEERRTHRTACLKAAVEWLVTFTEAEQRPTSSDVLKLAEKFEGWVYR